jgi:branched-chain amino acid aminotransferase
MDMIQVDHIMRTDPSRARLPHDKKYESGIAFINGDYCPLSEAAVPMLDLGFLQSDVVYDKVTVANGRYFRLADHFERFSASCASFRLRNPCTDEQMTAIFDKLLRLSGFKDAGVFWCVTR